jgi:hypothetical protein
MIPPNGRKVKQKSPTEYMSFSTHITTLRALGPAKNPIIPAVSRKQHNRPQLAHNYKIFSKIP